MSRKVTQYRIRKEQRYREDGTTGRDKTVQVVKNTTHHHMNSVLLGGKKTKISECICKGKKRENKEPGETQAIKHISGI